MANRWGNSGNNGWLYFLNKITADGDCSHEMKRCLLLGRKVMTNLDSILKSRDITLDNKGPSSQNYGFFSSHVWMWELDHKGRWMLKNCCFWSVVLEKTLESHFTTRRSKDWFCFGWMSLISLQSKALSRVSPAPQFKSINFSMLSLLYGPTRTLIPNYWKKSYL